MKTENPNPILFAHLDAFASHLTDARNASRHTVRSYTRDVLQFLDWLESEKLLRAGQNWDKVSYLMVRRYLGHLAQKEYARPSIVRKLSSLKAFFKWLERERLVEKTRRRLCFRPKLRDYCPMF